MKRANEKRPSTCRSKGLPVNNPSSHGQIYLSSLASAVTINQTLVIGFPAVKKQRLNLRAPFLFIARLLKANARKTLTSHGWARNAALRLHSQTSIRLLNKRLVRQQKHNKGAFILSQETCQLGAKCIQHLTLYNIWVIKERLKAPNQWNNITYGRKNLQS